MYTLQWYTLQKKAFKIAGSFGLALRWSRCWLNFAVIAGWQLRKCVILCLPSCRHWCGGRRDIAHALIMFAWNRCLKSSRVSHNLTIDFSSSRVSSCCFSCTALLACAPLSQSHKIPHYLPYVEAAAKHREVHPRSWSIKAPNDFRTNKEEDDQGFTQDSCED